jgi:iron-sulfur cluster assembly accessory protein
MDQQTTEKSEKKIHRQMTIEQILSMFPDKAQRLSQEITDAGLHCVGCHAATWETLEAGMLGHGMGEEQIERLVERLNALLEEIAQEVDRTKVSMTLRAAQKFLAIAQEENKQGYGVRLSERMAGCNGLEYELDFSKEAHPEEDAVFESHGVKIYIKKKAKGLLGVKIDYRDGLKGAGFTIYNPNVRSACGCGSSHNY